jgi:hypothetical protein
MILTMSILKRIVSELRKLLRAKLVCIETTSASAPDNLSYITLTLSSVCKTVSTYPGLSLTIPASAIRLALEHGLNQQIISVGSVSSIIGDTAGSTCVLLLTTKQRSMLGD